MTKTIKLKAVDGCVYINTKTLCYTTSVIYALREFADNWVQVPEKEVNNFIAELKAQKSDSAKE